MSHHNSELSEGKAWVCGPLSMSKRIAQRLKCVGDSIHLQSLENSFPVFIQYQRRLQSVLSQFEMSDYVSFFKQPLPTLKKEYYTFTSSHICEPYRKFQVNNLRQTVWNFFFLANYLLCPESVWKALPQTYEHAASTLLLVFTALPHFSASVLTDFRKSMFSGLDPKSIPKELSSDTDRV